MPTDRSVPKVHLHIGDERRTSGAGGVHEHVWPVTGEVQGPVPLAGPADVDAAVRADLWTKDISRINQLVPRLEAGGVYVNGASPVVGCELPFGGVGIYGFGREGGLEGLLEFVRTKAVAIA